MGENISSGFVEGEAEVGLFLDFILRAASLGSVCGLKAATANLKIGKKKKRREETNDKKFKPHSTAIDKTLRDEFVPG